MKAGIDRRKYPRYDTELKVFFRLAKYELKTTVKFKVLVGNHKGIDTHAHVGVSKNVSAEGLCFVSKTKLHKSDVLFVEVHEPRLKKPVRLEAQVRWSRKMPELDAGRSIYYTGVRVLLVNNKILSDSIRMDPKYRVAWSTLLDALFGNFAAILRKQREKEKKLSSR